MKRVSNLVVTMGHLAEINTLSLKKHTLKPGLVEFVQIKPQQNELSIKITKHRKEKKSNKSEQQ